MGSFELAACGLHFFLHSPTWHALGLVPAASMTAMNRIGFHRFVRGIRNVARLYYSYFYDYALTVTGPSGRTQLSPERR